jgi:hypothetical protein
MILDTISLFRKRLRTRYQISVPEAKVCGFESCQGEFSFSRNEMTCGDAKTSHLRRASVRMAEGGGCAPKLRQLNGSAQLSLLEYCPVDKTSS